MAHRVIEVSRITVRVGNAIRGQMTRLRDSSTESRMVCLLLLVGMTVSVVQFAVNRSLWLDEAYLSLNIINRGHLGLFKPLDFKQVAPVLFLQLEKVGFSLIPNEYGLRIIPLISFLFSLYLLYRVSRFVPGNPYSTLVALSLFVFNIRTVYYSSEVKQYMTDVLVALVLYFLALREFESPKKQMAYLTVAGVVSIYLSSVAPVILLSVGLYFLTDSKRRRDGPTLRSLATWSGITLLFFVPYFALFVHGHPNREGMIREWTYYRGFMPASPFSLQTARFLYSTWTMVFFSLFSFGRPMGIALAALALCGIIDLLRRRDFRWIALGLTPIVGHLVLSALKLYPMGDRLILYTIPSIIILISFGFSYLTRVVFEDLGIQKFRVLSLLVPAVCAIGFWRQGFPIHKAEIKQSIAHMKSNWMPDDRVYVSYLSQFPFAFYREISPAGFDSHRTTLGQKTLYWHEGHGWEADTALFRQELASLEGRTWFLFTNAGDEVEKRDFLLSYCSARGLEPILKYETVGSWAFLVGIEHGEH